MHGMLLPLIVATAVASFVWGIASIVTGSGRGERRRLQERLGEGNGQGSGRGRGGGGPPELAGKSITIKLDVEGLPAFLAERPFIQALNRRMLQAYPERSLGRFLMTAAVYAAVFGGITLVVTASFLVGGLAGLAGAYFPFMLLSMKANKRQRQIAMQLPEALDFLTRILRAGHSLSTGLQMMGEELPMPLCGEFRRAYDQHSLGVSLEDSLRETAARIESSDFAFFVTAVLIQRQTGGDLSEVLKNISGMIRGRVRLAQHVKAKTAEGRFTGYVLVAFPAVMFFVGYYMSPSNYGMLIHDPQGRMLLYSAVFLQVLGLFAIKKITKVEV